MVYHVPYEADFTCPKGHSFVAPVGAVSTAEHVTCPVCYRKWIEKNVPFASQQSSARQVRQRNTLASTMPAYEVPP